MFSPEHHRILNLDYPSENPSLVGVPFPRTDHSLRWRSIAPILQELFGEIEPNENRQILIPYSALLLFPPHFPSLAATKSQPPPGGSRPAR